MQKTLIICHLYGGGGETPFIRPNVSHCVEENEVHYNPRLPSIIVTYNITDVENSAILVPSFLDYLIYFEVDGVSHEIEQDVYDFNIGETGKHIVKYAFNTENRIHFNGQDDRITSVIIEEGYKSVDQWFFENCPNITSVSLPDSLETIPNGFFSQSTLLPTEGNITYADYVAVICADKTQSTYTFKDGTRFTAPWLFQNCTNLTTITLPSTLKPYGIGYQTFQGCTSLQTIVIPKQIKYLGNTTFDGCTSLTNVTFEEGSQLEELGGMVFSGCSSLEHLEFPNTLKSLYNSEFSNCDSLIDITFHSVVPPTLKYSVFKSNDTYTIYVPAESVEAYKTADKWTVAASRIQAIPTA